MQNTLTVHTLKSGLEKICAALEEAADELNRADAALGDGDLGVTALRGARSLRMVLQELPDDLGMALMLCAQAFTQVSGSTFGTLIATGLMAASRGVRGKEEMLPSELPGLFADAVDAMCKRSHAELGDKTVLDALDRLGKALAAAGDSTDLLEAGKRGVNEALEDFRPRPSKSGRARIFGQKSAGLDDPGMLAVKKMIDAL
jgi:phosphoenolpyruvate---glycerone phosphotransferase subunit DhaL